MGVHVSCLMNDFRPRHPVQVRFENIRVDFLIRSPTRAKSGSIWQELKQLNPFSHRVPKHVLHGLSGTFRPGRLTAILGSSGAGKSVFLNCVSGHIQSMPTARIRGGVYVNQERLPEIQFMQEIAGYVEQDDVITGTMTVREAIGMAARLRLPDITEDERQRRVDEVISKLRLDQAQNTYIGTAFRKGVSGGERKRTSIGMELITGSPLLFLDEPTSGLDAFTQLSVIRFLHDLSREGRTIVATIHSPSSQMLELFDDIIILAEGRILYQGPSDELVFYFASIGFYCPKFVNPADYVFLEVLHKKEELDVEETRAMYLERIRLLVHVYEESELKQRSTFYAHHPPPGRLHSSMLLQTASFWTQARFLMRRSVNDIIRDPVIFITRIIATSLLAVFVALVYLDISNTRGRPEATIQNILGAIFLLALNQVFLAYNAALLSFGQGKEIFLHEYSHKYYRVPAYYSSKLLVEIPLQVIFPILVSLIAYWIIGFRPGFDNFLSFTMFLTLMSLCGAALGLVVGAFLPATIAVIVAPLILLPLVIYGGFFVNSSNSPEYSVFIIHYCVLILSLDGWHGSSGYAFTGMANTELESRTFDGASGDAALNSIGASQRFSNGLNVVFLVTIFCAFLLLALVGLYRVIAKAGLSKRSITRERKDIVSREY